MKTFRILGMVLVAVMLGFAMSACSDDDDDYLKELEKEYARLIVGKWFNFTPEANAAETVRERLVGGLVLNIWRAPFGEGWALYVSGWIGLCVCSLRTQ